MRSEDNLPYNCHELVQVGIYYSNCTEKPRYNLKDTGIDREISFSLIIDFQDMSTGKKFRL